MKVTAIVAMATVLACGALGARPDGGSMVRATGGWITRTTEGSHILLADARKEATDLETVRREMEEMCCVPIRTLRVKHGGTGAFKEAAALVTKDAGLVVFVYDGSGDEPTLVVCPENRVALVNATPLVTGVDMAKASGRTERELWRALVYLGGGIFSAMPSVMRPVFSPQDIDGIECRTASPIETSMINTCAGAFGLARIQKTTYRTACKQGWAPAPTNEFQKAIWDKVKADKERGPTNPITIPPPSAKK